MILCDVNVLLCAYREDALDHSRHREWLMDTIHGPAPYGVSPQVLSSVLRIATNPRVFARPASQAEALAFCRMLLERPGAHVVAPGERHWSVFEDLCRRSGATGNLVPDAWFAALAIESGCEWITVDRDYARFPGLRWRTPF